MANVSVSGIEGTASEIQGVNDILKNTATNTSTSSDRISKLATEFASYNNQVVAENTPHTIGLKSVNSIDYYEEYDTWVTTTGGLESRASSLASKAEEINSVVDKITTKVADTQTIATAIQGYIDTVQGILENNGIAASISSTALSSAFLALGRDGVAKANLATSGKDINSRNFLDYDSIKDDEKLNGGLLSFEKQDDGSYLIKKDGESTGYYTTGLAAGLYMKTLTTTVENEYKTFSSATSKFSDNADSIKNNTTGSSKENLNSDKIDLKEEEIRIHKANESANKNTGTSSSKGNLNSDKIDLKEEEIRIHKANESANKESGNYSKSEQTATTKTANSYVTTEDLSGKTRTIDEFKPKTKPDSYSAISGVAKKETYLESNGNKSVFTTYKDNKQSMNVYDKNNNILASRTFDETGKQTGFVVYSYGDEKKAYTVKNGSLIELRSGR